MLGVNIGSTFAGDIDVKTMSSVSFNDNTLYVGGSGPNNYTSIQDAINDATDGDTVFVYNGIYDGGIIVNKSITLQGENRENTFINGAVGISDNGISIISDGVYLTGFTIQYVNTFWPDSAIYINAYDTVIDNNIINDNKFGIDLYKSENTRISNNLIINQNRCDGIYVSFSSNNIISNNIISDNNGYGIIFTESTNNIIFENSISNNNWGGLTIQDENNIGNLIYHNNFFNNKPDNSWDVGLNYWNNSYPIGGNFWDDYIGIDENDDGIGDTPYYITGGDNMDNYPIICPYVYNDTILEISSISTKPCSIMVDLKNTGNCPAVKVNWSMVLDGGLILFNKESMGDIEYVFYGDLQTIFINNSIGFGNSQLTITVEALNVEMFTTKIDVFIFFIFIIIKLVR
jgi:parallel beta-helix repeat protein